MGWAAVSVRYYRETSWRRDPYKRADWKDGAACGRKDRGADDFMPCPVEVEVEVCPL